MSKVVLYFHGFGSAGEGETVQLLRRLNPGVLVLSKSYPTHSPMEAFSLLQGWVLDQMQGHSVVLVGTSLGGFFANLLGRVNGLPSLMVNPALVPEVLLRKYLGHNVNFATHESFELTEADLVGYGHLSQISKGLGLSAPSSVVLFEGDELIDYKQTLELLDSKVYVRQVKNGGHRITSDTVSPVIECLKALL